MSGSVSGSPTPSPSDPTGPASSPTTGPASAGSSSQDALMSAEGSLLGNTPGFTYQGTIRTFGDFQSWLNAKADYLGKQNPSQAAELKQASGAVFKQYMQSIQQWFFNEFKQSQSFQQQQEQDRKQNEVK